MTRRKQNSTRPIRKGAAAVEMAIIAPIAILIVVSAIDVVRLNMLRSVCQSATYEAARTARSPSATLKDIEADALARLEPIRVKGASVSVQSSSGPIEKINIKVEIPVNQNSFVFAASNQMITSEASVDVANSIAMSAKDIFQDEDDFLEFESDDLSIADGRWSDDD